MRGTSQGGQNGGTGGRGRAEQSGSGSFLGCWAEGRLGSTSPVSGKLPIIPL